MLLSGQRKHRQLVVLLTGNGDQHARSFVGPDGFDRIYEKPMNLKDMAELLIIGSSHEF